MTQRIEKNILALEEILKDYQDAKAGKTIREHMCPLCYYNHDRCYTCAWSKFFLNEKTYCWYEMKHSNIPCIKWLHKNYPYVRTYDKLLLTDMELQDLGKVVMRYTQKARDHRIVMIKEWIRQLKSEL